MQEMLEYSGKRIVSDTLLIMILTIIGYCIGFATQIVAASYFGVGKELDTFVAAAVIPEFLFSITNAIFFTSFVVLFPLYIKEKGNTQANKFVSQLFTVLLVMVCLIAALLFFLSPFVASVIAPGFDAGQIKLTSSLIKILSLAVIFYGLNSFLTGILYHEHNFFGPKTLRIVLGLGIIFSLIVFYNYTGILSLAIGTVIGLCLAFIIQLFEVMKQNYRFTFLFTMKETYCKKLLILAWPLIMTSIIYYGNKGITNIIASTLEQGSLSILNYAFLIVNIPLIIIPGSIAAAVFPHISKQSAYNKMEELRTLFTKSLNMSLFFIVPITCVFFLLNQGIIQILLQRGEFTGSSTYAVAKTLLFFSIGLVPWTVFIIILNVFYAMEKMKQQMYVWLLYMGLNIGLILVLLPYFSYNAIALASSIAFWMVTVLVCIYIKKVVPTISYKAISISILKLFIASIALSIIIILIKPLFTVSENTLLNIMNLIFILFLGIMVYLMVLWFLKSKELKDISILIKELL